ncbi:MAG: hypothetical protein WBP40_00935 [Candidatus Moraniibacteriota bacterium]
MSTQTEIDGQFPVISPEPDPIGDQMRLLQQAVEQLGDAIHDWRDSLSAALDRAALHNPVSIVGPRRWHHPPNNYRRTSGHSQSTPGSVTCAGTG